MDFLAQRQKTSALPPLSPIDSTSPAAADLFLIDPDLSLNKPNEPRLVESASSEQPATKREDALIALYRYYSRFQRSAEAESTAFALLKLRIEGCVEGSKLAMRELLQFYASHDIVDLDLFVQTFRGILNDEKLSKGQHWACYKEATTFCYSCGHYEEAAKLLPTPPESVCEAAYEQWCSTLDQIAHYFSVCKRLHYKAAGNAVLWTRFQIQRNRSGLDQAAVACLLRFFDFHINKCQHPWLFMKKSVNDHFYAGILVLQGLLDPHIADMLTEMMKDDLPMTYQYDIIAVLRDAIAVYNRTTKSQLSESYMRLFQRSAQFQGRDYVRDSHFLKCAFFCQQPTDSNFAVVWRSEASKLYMQWRRECGEAVLVRMERSHSVQSRVGQRARMISIRQIYR